MAELKPCPFCGGNAIVVANLHRHDETSYFVKCNNKDCHIIPETYWCAEMNDAIEIWNRRAEDGNP